MTDKTPIEFNEEELRQKINLETGKLSWAELTPHFAKGVVVVIDPSLDLIDVAVKFCADDKAQFEQWTNDGLVHRALDDDARHWNEANAEFWTCVVAPWVLVQEITNKD